MSDLHELAREYAREVLDKHKRDGLNTSLHAEAGRMEQAFIAGYNKSIIEPDSELKKQLEMAQAFQLELADVDWVAMVVTSGFAPILREGYVSVDVSTYKDSKPDQHFNLIGDQVTEQALEEIKDNLRGLGYEV